jgi:hypothetical protein
MQNLDALVVPDDPLKAQINLVAVVDINNAGQIVGWGTDGHGGNYGVLLTPTPVPEPADWALLLVGLSLTGILARWRQVVSQLANLTRRAYVPPRESIRVARFIASIRLVRTSP